MFRHGLRAEGVQSIYGAERYCYSAVHLGQGEGAIRMAPKTETRLRSVIRRSRFRRLRPSDSRDVRWGGWPGVVVFPPRGETPADKPHFASEVAARLGEAYPLESLRRASHRIEELQAGTEMFRYKGPTDQPILLIDDVSTTGVTIGAARAALQSAGHTGVVLAVVWAQAV